MLKRINKKQLIFVSLIAVMLFLTWSFTTLITRAYDRFSDTGVQLDNTRTLTIKSKDVANAFDTFTTSSLNFETSLRAESLSAVTARQVKYKITKLLPASGYKEVLPRVEASYVKSTASIYVSNNVGAGYGDIKLLFNGPYNIENDLPNTKGNNQTKGAVLFDLDGSNHSYGFISTDDGATYSEFDNGSSSQRTQLNKFLSGNSVDGAYMIELIDAPTNQWKTIVEIPTIKNSDSEFRNYFNNFGLTEHINYDPIVYAKVKEKQVAVFNSYANAFGYFNASSTSFSAYGKHQIAAASYFMQTNATSLTDLQITGAFNSDFVSVPEEIASTKIQWGSITCVNTFPQTLSVTMNLTAASDYDSQQYMNLGMAIKDGFEVDESKLATYTNGNATTPKFDTNIALSVDKKYSIGKVRPFVLIRNYDMPTRSQVLYLKDPSVTVTDSDDSNALLDYTKSTLPAMYSVYDTSNPSTLRGQGTNLEYPFYKGGDHFYLRSKMGNFNREKSSTDAKTIRGYITEYILSNTVLPTTSSIFTGVQCGYYDKFTGTLYGSKQIVNSMGYTTSSEIYAEDSKLGIEFGFTAEVLFNGKDFKTGTTKADGFTPFTIGVTNELLTDQSVIDIATFSTTGIKKSMATEAFFTTGQYNAYKVNQDRKPLNDAGFTLLYYIPGRGDYFSQIQITRIKHESTTLKTVASSASISSILNKKYTSTAIGAKMSIQDLYDLYNVATPSTIASEYYFTSGAIPTAGGFTTDGAIIILGVDPDTVCIPFEIKAPEGYKIITGLTEAPSGYYSGKVYTGHEWYYFNSIRDYYRTAKYVSWLSQAAYSMDAPFADLNPAAGATIPAINLTSVAAMRMAIFINVPELGLPNTGGIALGIILILGIASVSTGLYVRKRNRLNNLKRLIS